MNWKKCVIVAMGAAACSASAELVPFAADINGANEVPSRPSPATGTMTGVYDTVANSFAFQWVITDDLLGTPTAGAHIHHAPAGTNGPIQFGFSNSDGSWDLTGSSTWLDLTAEQVGWLNAGELYINFHTSEFPGGEVRGQILVVPASGSVALCVAAAGLVCVRRKR